MSVLLQEQNTILGRLATAVESINNRLEFLVAQHVDLGGPSDDEDDGDFVPEEEEADIRGDMTAAEVALQRLLEGKKKSTEEPEK